MTDNRVRTAADVRHAFSKHGGNLGTDGSVAFLFKHCGQIVFEPGADENKIMELAIDAGAEDVLTNEDGSVEVITDPYEFVAIKDVLTRGGLHPSFAEVSMVPSTVVELKGEDAEKMQKLIDALESLDDVQEVYSSAEFLEE
jgi:YebC/PmpR family DNA-binding regulatory protein